ncbi:MAG: roadblock/LC7 domain-containing protein [Planctomycetes bacterium]|nr:roadblock/LC7 domain-containing protein [Planctomycetota bacterium]
MGLSTGENQQKTDERLRQDRLVFYAEDVEAFDRVLEEFLALSSAKCVLLIDRDGHLVAKKGEAANINCDSISALVAGSFAATKEMARILGESEFRIMYHQGSRDQHIQISLVGDRTLFTILFDERTTLGMIRFYANETGARLAEIFQKAKDRRNPPEQEVSLGDAFSDSAKSMLGEILGGN